jgi:hypothetical protein
MSGTPGQEVVDGKIRFNESLPAPSFEMSEMGTYYIDHILQYDFCNALRNFDIGFSDPNITPEIMTARIKVLTGLILELDSQVLNNLGIDITVDLSKEELFDKYHPFVSDAFKNILIKKAYKR